MTVEGGPVEGSVLASFRSRQQALKLEEGLLHNSIEARIVSTPRPVAQGCGISVRFPLADIEKAADMIREKHLDAFSGFYVRNGAATLEKWTHLI